MDQEIPFTKKLTHFRQEVGDLRIYKNMFRVRVQKHFLVNAAVEHQGRRRVPIGGSVDFGCSGLPSEIAGFEVFQAK